MKISDEIKKHFFNIMYTTKVKVYETIEEVDEELNVVRIKGQDIEELLCNIQPVNKSIMLNNYGLDIDAKYLLTTNVFNYPKTVYIEHERDTYKISEILKYESHYKVFIDKVKE